MNCYYDYTCPYSYRAFQWLTRLEEVVPDLAVEWRTFALKEANRDPHTPSPFDDPEISSVSVLALALAHAARRADFARYHARVFEAMQVRRLGELDVLAVAADAGVDLDSFEEERPRWLRQVAEAHDRATSRWRVFGTPTLILDGDAAVFLKLAEVPARNDDEEVWSALCVLARCHPELMEIKRP
ncbi:MAG: DsbA family protein [Acidimicrobiales bacterium]